MQCVRFSALVCTFATANAVHNIQCSALHFCELMQCIISFFGASPTPGGPTCPNMSPRPRCWLLMMPMMMVMLYDDDDGNDDENDDDDGDGHG